MPSDGRFRVVVFGGNVGSAAQRSRVNDFGAWLRGSLVPRYHTVTFSSGSDPYGGTLSFRLSSDPSVIDVVLVHCAPREAIEPLRDLDDAYHLFDEALGWDYSRVFVDGESYHEGHGRAYEGYGVDPAGEGVVVVVRPDGYVGLVADLGDAGRGQLLRWFDGVLQSADSL